MHRPPASPPVRVSLDSWGNLSAGKEPVLLENAPGLLTLVFRASDGRETCRAEIRRTPSGAPPPPVRVPVP